MNFLFIFIPIVFLILSSVIPIVLKFKITVENNTLYISIFNKNVYSEDNLNLKNLIFKFSKMHSKTNKVSFKKILCTLSKHRIKINLSPDITYGFNDPSHTAIFHGCFPMIYMTAINYLNRYFNVSTKKLNYNPDFNSPTFKINISCIISISLVQIISIINTIKFK